MGYNCWDKFNQSVASEKAVTMARGRMGNPFDLEGHICESCPAGVGETAANHDLTPNII